MTQTAVQTTSASNSVQFIGYLGKNPTQDSDNAPTTFDLAVWQGKDRDKMWLTVKCWGSLAKAVLADPCIYRGVKVLVKGRLTSEKHGDKIRFAVVASSVEIVNDRLQQNR